jgi:hypothetical protein
MFMATTVATEDGSRRVYRGPGEFPWKAAVPGKRFMEECEVEGIFDPSGGGVYFKKFGDFLEKVKRAGLPTENSNVRLWLKDWEIRW